MPVKMSEDFYNHPVVQVSYADAEAYACWLKRRLPTEEEWEYAAAGKERSPKYPCGEEISRSQANYGSKGTCAVMGYSPNGYGLYDMPGNVWEWTSSWYKAYPGNIVGGEESENFGEKYRVVRGGAWMYDDVQCMTSYRNASDPSQPYPTVGFRTVCS